MFNALEKLRKGSRQNLQAPNSVIDWRPIVHEMRLFKSAEELAVMRRAGEITALAKELRVAKLVYLSDVPGLLADPKDPASLIHSVSRKHADAMIADGTISGGMIPKIRSAVDALNAGVRKVHFVDGRLPHALLLEIFTDGGIGTEVVR